MNDFPGFMKDEENRIAPGQSSDGVQGWVYDGTDGKQMAYFVCGSDGVSAEHVHPFDEYFIVLQGMYILIMDGRRIEMGKGGEYLIPKLVPHSGEFAAGTRTIHCFGGQRASRAA